MLAAQRTQIFLHQIERETLSVVIPYPDKDVLSSARMEGPSNGRWLVRSTSQGPVHDEWPEALPFKLVASAIRRNT